MLYVIVGSLAFVFLFIFDINKVKHYHKLFNAFFAIGVLLLAVSTIEILFSEKKALLLTFPYGWFSVA